MPCATVCIFLHFNGNLSKDIWKRLKEKEKLFSFSRLWEEN